MKDFFLLDDSISCISRTKIGSTSSVGSFFSALFDDGTAKTEDYYAIQKTSSGFTVKYYLTKFHEIYRSNWWAISIQFNDEIGQYFDKIANACHWNLLFTEDSLKYAFRNFPNIYKVFIQKNSISYYYRELNRFIHDDYLSPYEEKEAIEELCNTTFNTLKELAHFKLDINDLVKKRTE